MGNIFSSISYYTLEMKSIYVWHKHLLYLIKTSANVFIGFPRKTNCASDNRQRLGRRYVRTEWVTAHPVSSHFYTFVYVTFI